MVQCEAKLSGFNKETINFTMPNAYFQNTNELNPLQRPFFYGHLVCKLKLGSYMRR